MNVWVTTCNRDIEQIQWFFLAVDSLGIERSNFTVCWTDGDVGVDFDGVESVTIDAPQREGESNKYAAVNSSFYEAMWYARQREEDFLFAESDCTFLHPKAIDILKTEFEFNQTLMMGKLVFTPQPADISLFPKNQNQIRTNGVSVYSWRLADILLERSEPPANKPFDTWLAPHYIKYLSPTNRIIHCAKADELGYAVIEHGCKDGTLAKLVNENMDSNK